VRNANPKLSARSYGWGYNYSGLGLDHAARVLSPISVGLPAGRVDVQGDTDLHRGDHRCWARIHMGWKPVGSVRGRHDPASLCIAPGEAVGHFAHCGDSHVVARQRRSGHESVHGSNRSPSTILLSWVVPVAPILFGLRCSDQIANERKGTSVRDSRGWPSSPSVNCPDVRTALAHPRPDHLAPSASTRHKPQPRATHPESP
jgi:hypothetical protein